MDESLQAQLDTQLRQLESLIRRGREIRGALSRDPANPQALLSNRAWQQDCGVIINQLSGSSKAHWLARAFSEAFLVRSTGGQAVEGVAPAEIVERLIGVLGQAVASLKQMGEGPVSVAALESAPAPRRFGFVHNAELRPILEQAYAESRRALDQGDAKLALVTTCGILEAIVTDALEYKGVSTLADTGIPEEPIADWPFETRLAVAEGAGLIRASWMRLPEVARKYRELSDSEGDLNVEITDGDARRAQQVLHVVMKDLDPGR